tara:strand:- start:196 stop:651 length:456 start_codon:yes stop_codon:yes gene_type:complete
MTYKELINSLQATITAHLMVNTQGYGNISDIAVPENEAPPNYPYVFINPVSVNLNRNSFNCDVNLICMTQVHDDANASQTRDLDGQDLCIQILSDIIAEYILTIGDPLFDIAMPLTLTPFKERFQDNVVGATAGLTMQYGKSISACVIPIV